MDPGAIPQGRMHRHPAGVIKAREDGTRRVMADAPSALFESRQSSSSRSRTVTLRR
jgi:hypothetical protein